MGLWVPRSSSVGTSRGTRRSRRPSSPTGTLDWHEREPSSPPHGISWGQEDE